MTRFTQLAYVSMPFGYDVATLDGILRAARRCNARDAITGALVCRHDIFLQLIEGPAAQVEATYARIARDDRHGGMVNLLRRETSARLFAGWDMLHDPAQSVIWSRDEVASGHPERATPAEVLALFGDLADRAGAARA